MNKKKIKIMDFQELGWVIEHQNGKFYGPNDNTVVLKNAVFYTKTNAKKTLDILQELGYKYTRATKAFVTTKGL